MATITLQKARAVKTISGNSPQVLVFPEASGQGYKAGEFVYLSSGKVTEVADGAALIAGMACQDASGTVDTDAPIYVANDDTIFELNKVTATAGTSGAGATGTTTAVTDVGNSYGLYRDTTNNITHLGASGSGRFHCIALSEKDAVGDTGGRLLVILGRKYSQLIATS